MTSKSVNTLRSVAALAIVLVAGIAPTAFAARSPAETAVLEGCRQRVLLIPGAEEPIRRRVPAQFELVRDPLGRPLTYVVAARCNRWSRADRPGPPTTFGFFVAIIEPPDGRGCGAEWPVVGGLRPDLFPICDLYNFFVAYDNPEVVRLQRDLIPDFPVYYVGDHVFRDEPFDPKHLGVPFHFRAGAGTERPGTPSPFTIDAVAREGSLPTPRNMPLIFSFWWPAPGGTFQGFRLKDNAFVPGQMDAQLRVAPGSEMAEMLGSETPRPIMSFANRYSAEGWFIPPPGGSFARRPTCMGRVATIVGSRRIAGTARNDVIVGSNGPDRIDGRGGQDRICAGRGRDRVKGGAGRDRLLGGAGRDRIHSAGGGRDRVNCGGGRDRVRADRRDRVKRCERILWRRQTRDRRRADVSH